MTTVVLFPSVLGVRQGEHEAAARLRAAGHDVVVPDLYGEGRTFDAYEPAIEQLGDDLYARGLAALDGVAGAPVVAGFSQGAGVAVFVATRRPVAGVLQLSALITVHWFGPDARWPAGVGTQRHQMLGDPFREDEVTEQAVRDVTDAGGRIELFDYPGDGHLFTDPTLPAEHDAAATELLWSRALPFVAACGSR